MSENSFDMQELKNPMRIGEYFQITANESDEVMAFWAYLTETDGIKNVELHSNALSTNTGISELSPVNENIVFNDIYPNPATDKIKISFETKLRTTGNYYLINTEGKK